MLPYKGDQKTLESTDMASDVGPAVDVGPPIGWLHLLGGAKITGIQEVLGKQDRLRLPAKGEVVGVPVDEACRGKPTFHDHPAVVVEQNPGDKTTIGIVHVKWATVRPGRRAR